MEKPREYGNIHWLSDDDYAKCVGTARSKINIALKPLSFYGQQPLCDISCHIIMKILEDFGLQVRGIDHETDHETIKHLEMISKD
jgi:hypothetical protein